MAASLIDTMASLTLIMNEESERVRGQERAHDLAELAAAKVRLVGQLDTELARLNREQPDWAKQLDGDVREQLSNTLIALGDAATANAAVLERQIDLSAEMMGALAAEARRLTNNRASTYDKAGDVSQLELTAPISFNTQY